MESDPERGMRGIYIHSFKGVVKLNITSLGRDRVRRVRRCGVRGYAFVTRPSNNRGYERLEIEPKLKLARLCGTDLNFPN